jgi:hypothetical protein
MGEFHIYMTFPGSEHREQSPMDVVYSGDGQIKFMFQTTNQQ